MRQTVAKTLGMVTEELAFSAARTWDNTPQHKKQNKKTPSWARIEENIIPAAFTI
jgi:hypothetical protein